MTPVPTPAPVPPKGATQPWTRILRSPRLARKAPVLAAVLSALWLALASPPAGWDWLAWIAPTPLFWALLSISDFAPGSSAEVASPPHPRISLTALTTGFTFGAVSLLLLVPWFAAFTPVGYVVAAGLWGLLGAAFAGVLTALLRRTQRWAAPPLLASGWTLLEWVHAQGALAFPWGTLAATQHRQLPVLQVLDLCGAYGLSFLMALFAASLALGILAGSDTTAGAAPFRLIARRWLIGAAALIAACVARGEWILLHPVPVAQSVRVAVIQESQSIQIPGAAVVCRSPWPDYAEASRAALRAGAELVVWPESACKEDAAHDGLTHSLFAGVLSEGRGHLLTGSFVDDPGGDGTSNAAVMLAPDASVLGVYEKVQIVPFGEYLPARPLLAWTTALGMPAEDLRAGHDWNPLPWARGLVGTSICFESAFGQVSRTYVNRGANLLAVLTSDGWAGRDAAGLQHATFSPLRAVETRRSVARAAATGVSALIDPYGRPLQQLPMFQRGYRMAELPLRTDRTLYVLLGDWPVALSLLVLLAAGLQAIGIRAFRRSGLQGSMAGSPDEPVERA